MAHGAPAQGSKLSTSSAMVLAIYVWTQSAKVQNARVSLPWIRHQGSKAKGGHLVAAKCSIRDRSSNETSSRSCKQRQVVSCRIGIIPLPCFPEAVLTGLPLSKHSGYVHAHSKAALSSDRVSLQHSRVPPAPNSRWVNELSSQSWYACLRSASLKAPRILLQSIGSMT